MARGTARGDHKMLSELGERAGYTASGGTFGAYLGTLRRNGLIAVDGDAVRAGAALFLNGLRAGM